VLRRATHPQSLPFDMSGFDDPLELNDLMHVTNGVKQPSATTFTGTVDLVQAGGLSCPSSDELSPYGAKPSSTPFTAKVDSKQNLVQLVVDTTSFDKTLYRKFTFSDYGAPHAIVAPPASEVVPATAENYKLFTG
jgi:hypothetical protein